MTDDLGVALVRLLRESLFSLLSDALAEFGHVGSLDELAAAGPDWAASGFAEHLLESPVAVVPANPVTATVIGALRTLTSVSGPDAVAGLFGWEPDPVGHTRARGIACAIRIGPAAAPAFAAAAAITVDGAGSPRIDLVAKGDSGAQARSFALDGSWTLAVSGRTADVVAVGLPLADDPTVDRGATADTVTLHLTRAASGEVHRPGINLGAVDLTATVTLGDGRPELTGALRISRGSVEITPGDLAAILPELAPVPLDVTLGWSSLRGVDLAGSPTLTARLPTGASLPGLSTGPLDLTLMPRPDPARPAVSVQVTCPVSLELPVAPIDINLAGLGFALPFGLGGPGLGFDFAALVPQPPTGAGIALDLPVVDGAGLLERAADGYQGMLALQVPPLSVNAFGLLDPHTAALLVLLTAAFPPPGVEIGFGFAVTDVGGIVGVGRRADPDVLTRMVQDGSAAKLLFPADPEHHAGEILPLLDRAFPVSPESVVVGPMLRITWSELILDASVAVVVELPDPVRISVIGRVEVAVPAPALPLIRLRAAFLGVADPAVPSMSFLAALTDSNIAGVTVTGDAYLLARGGAQADVILSAGGFHPRFTRPAGVPPLDRVAITLAAGPVLSLRCQAYLAITTNTVQFGAAVDLVAEIAGCGLRGHLGFDVLVHLSPLHFTAEIGVTVAVEVFGETLMGISLDLTLEGPSPWRARGRGRIHLFLFSASLYFDESWGTPAVPAGLPPQLQKILTDAFARPEAWTAHTPLTDTLPVQLNAAGRALLANGTALHPRGSLSARERALPLGVTIDQFNRAPVAPQRWDVARPTLGGAAVAPVVDEEREQFAPAQFQSMTDDEQLSRPAFESFRAGLRFVGDTIVVAEDRTADVGYETAVISQVVASRASHDVDAGTALAAAEQATSSGINDPRWWPPPGDVVVAADAPTFTVVDRWSFTAATDLGQLPGTATEQFEQLTAVAAADPARALRVAPAWEVLA
jgi:hypothetical protein